MLTLALYLSSYLIGTSSSKVLLTSIYSILSFPFIIVLYNFSGKILIQLVPSTISTNLYDFFIFSKMCFCCVMHPTIAIYTSSFFSFLCFNIPSLPKSVFSAFSLPQQVLNKYTFELFSSPFSNPIDSNIPAYFSESFSFI